MNITPAQKYYKLLQWLVYSADGPQLTWDPSLLSNSGLLINTMKAAVKIFGAAAILLVPLGMFFVNQAIGANKLDSYLEALHYPTNGWGKKSAATQDHQATQIGTSKMVVEEVDPPFIGYRLPDDFSPEEYRLSLRTDLEAGTFEGVVDIKVACEVDTSVVKLHSKGLMIDMENIRVDETEIKSGEVPKEDSDNDFLVIKLKEKMISGMDYMIRIPFSGKLDEHRTGYHLSKYTDINDGKKVERLMAVTQFKPMHAREVFPCFDEPHIKSSFTIILGHKKDYQAVSNMPLKDTTGPDKDGWVWDEFKASVAMSTYMVGFMVSDSKSFTSVRAGDKAQIWGRHNIMLQVPFVGDIIPKIMDNYVNDFNIKFPLQKVDLLVVPELSHEAMENWGLITIREESMLIDKEWSSGDERFQAASLVARELAEQWLSNLVCMKWWSDVWLSKGIASYFSSLVLQKLNGDDWDTHDYNIGTSFLRVFKYDSFETSRPISEPIDSPREVNRIYAVKNNHKVFLVLYMMISLLGIDQFKAAVGSYIKENIFGSTTEDRFWDALEAEAQEQKVLPPQVPVKAVVDSWTKQAGFPVLNVKLVQGTFTVSQKRFFKGKPTSVDPEKDCWFVPVTFAIDSIYRYNNNPNENMWLSCTQREIGFDTGVADPNFFIILNTGVLGLYRVNYDGNSWNNIIESFLGGRSSLIPTLNRMQLISDAMEMAFVGELPYKQAFRLLQYILGEQSLLPWMAAISSIEELRQLLMRTDEIIPFQKTMSSIALLLYQKYVFTMRYFKGPNILGARFVTLAFTFACNFGISSCHTKTKEMWNYKLQNGIPKDVRGVVYCEVVRQGNENDWKTMFYNYQESEIITDRRHYLEALGCTTDKKLLKRFLDNSLSESSGVRKQDSWRAFWATADYSKNGFEEALDFLLHNLQKIHNYHKPNTAVLGKYFEVLSKKLVFKEEIEQMKQFISDNKDLLQDCWMAVTQAMEQMDINLHWHETHYKTIGSNFVNQPL